jgi:hypothetical protein
LEGIAFLQKWNFYLWRNLDRLPNIALPKYGHAFLAIQNSKQAAWNFAKNDWLNVRQIATVNLVGSPSMTRMSGTSSDEA